MHDFAQFLLAKHFVPSGKEKFYVHWVRLFLELRTKWQNMPWQDQLPLFLKELSFGERYQDWQIRQADQAVRMYYCNFLPSEESVSLTLQVAKRQDFNKTEVIGKFYDALRLRNYARSTEKTYIHWVSRYFYYCDGQTTQPTVMDYQSPDMVKNFLTYLAVHKKISGSTQNVIFTSFNEIFPQLFRWVGALIVGSTSLLNRSQYPLLSLYKRG
jgi:hypothetical protein